MDNELDDQIKELSRLISTMSGEINTISSIIARTKTSVDSSDAATKNNTNAQDANSKGTTKLQQIISEVDKKNDDFKETIKEAFDHSVNMLTSFGGALISSETGLKKYSRTIESLGAGASTLGQNFGILGTVFGGIIGLFGRFATDILGLNENIIAIRDNFAKVGGTLPTNTANLGELAKAARFSIDNMKVLGDQMTALSGSMTSLGGTAGEGALAFMQIAAVDDNIRRQFGRLGVSQDRLLELQGLYVESQRVSGARLLNETKTADEMQRESLQYAKTLMMLSSVTGQNAEELQKEINTVKLATEEQAQQLNETREIARLRSLNRKDEADRLERERNNRLKMIEVYTAFYGRDTALQLARVYRTGAIDSQSAGLAMLAIDGGVLAMTERIKESEDIGATLSREASGLDRAMGEQAEIFGSSLQYEEDLGRQVGLFTDAITRLNNRPGSDIEADVSRILSEMDTRGEKGVDQQADRYESVRSFEREAQAFFQTLLEYIDPMRDFNKFMAIALGAAAAALTGLAVVKVGRSLLGGLLTRGSNLLNPNNIIISDLPGGLGGGGGSAALAGSASDPTGLGLRRADIVDRNGRPLQGAALDARMRRLSNERLPQTTTAALKMAARNAGTIIKGGAALGAAIAAIGAGIAGATWIIGKAIPTFAAGLKKFNEVDGQNLKGVGIGMAGLGAGILALTMQQGLGAIVSLFTDKSPLEEAVKMLVKFQKLDINADKVEKNGRAAGAYALAMGKLSIMGEFSAIVAGLTSFFEGPKIPYDDIREFSTEEFDAEKVEKNSNAFIKFSNAMASYQGFGALDGLGATSTALADAVLKYYEIDPPEQRLKEFSDLEIDPERTSLNAIAFKSFAEGLSAYRGTVGPSALSAISSLIGDKINKIFGVDGPIEAFVRFSQREDIGINADKNARAFFNFARALRMLTGGSFSGNIIDAGASMLSGATSWLSGTFGTGSSSTGANLDASRAAGPWRNDASFMREVERVSRKYGFSSGALIGLMISESNVNPQARNPNGGATGLIQFMPSTARSLGTTTDALYRMNRTQQMAYVDRYFQPYSNGLRGASAGKLYAYVFLPGRANRASGILTQRGENYYEQNRGLDVNRDGRIAISDLDRRIADKLQGARVGGLFAGPTSGYPIELHGTELIVPVDVNSVLMKMATDPANAADNTASTNQPLASNSSPAGNRARNKSAIDSQKIESISAVFDRIISTIESTDDIDQKILRYN